MAQMISKMTVNGLESNKPGQDNDVHDVRKEACRTNDDADTGKRDSIITRKIGQNVTIVWFRMTSVRVHRNNKV